MTKTLPPAELLWDLFAFSPLTGELFWRVPKQGRSRCRPVGTNDCGYRKVVVDRKPLLLHRVVWKWVTGDDPGKLFIDHIDRVRSNNSFHNLRLVDPVGNSVNNPHKGYYLRTDRKRAKPWCVHRYISKGTRKVEHYATEAEAKARSQEIYQTRMLEPPAL